MRRKIVAVTLVALSALAVLGIAAISPAADLVEPEVPICIRSMSVSASGCSARPEFDLELDSTPRELPAGKLVPLAVDLRGEISSSDGGRTSSLEEISVGIDKHAAIDTGDLAACPRATLAQSGPRTARRLCRDALIGTGSVGIAIGSADLISLPLTLFNGPRRGGMPTAFLHTAGDPFSPLFTRVDFRQTDDGRYRLEAMIEIPPIVEPSGAVVSFQLRIGRRPVIEGSTQSYLSASCADGRLQAGVSVGLIDGTRLAATLLNPCEREV